MSNVALVQSLYAAFGRGDIESIIAGLAADVAWDVTGRREDYPLCGRWQGAEQVRKFFAGVAELQESQEFSPKEFIAVDDRVFVLGHYSWTFRKTGRKIATDWIHVFTIRGGAVVAFREFTDTAQFAAAHHG
jgi:uncharacterized protein